MVEKEIIKFYDLSYWDIASIPFVDLAIDFTLYNVHITNPKYVVNKTEEKEWGLATWSLWQSEKEIESKYTVDTLDIILVNAGGFSAFVCGLWLLVFGWYSAYRYEATLGNELYQAEKKKRKNEQKDDLMEVAECIANRREFTFNFFENFFLKVTNVCWCCCKESECMQKRRKRYIAYNEVSERYRTETDICTLIKE
jgi:hypothetical protein